MDSGSTTPADPIHAHRIMTIVARISRLGGTTKFIVSSGEPITDSMHAGTLVARDTLSTEVGLRITSLYRTPRLSGGAGRRLEPWASCRRRTGSADQSRFDG